MKHTPRRVYFFSQIVLILYQRTHSLEYSNWLRFRYNNENFFSQQFEKEVSFKMGAENKILFDNAENFPETCLQLQHIVDLSKERT